MPRHRSYAGTMTDHAQNPPHAHETTPAPKLTYVFDAYCGWCYGFEAAFGDFARSRADSAAIEVISGGLFVGSRVGPIGAFTGLHAANERITALTGAQFGPAFRDLVDDGEFVLDSTDAARGFAAVRAQAPHRSVEIAQALQSAFYLQGASLSDARTYRAVADRVGLDGGRAEAEAFTDASSAAAEADFARASNWGVRGFPTVVLEVPGRAPVAIGSATSTADELRAELDGYLGVSSQAGRP